jgi:hypothetical protein
MDKNMIVDGLLKDGTRRLKMEQGGWIVEPG